MTDYVVDASVVIKWVVQEPDSERALRLRGRGLAAPDLLFSECANILWKKARRNEITRPHAIMAIRYLIALEIRLVPARSLLQRAFEFSMEIDHPSYDCVYLATAVEQNCPLVTADRAFARRVSQGGLGKYVQLLDSIDDTV